MVNPFWDHRASVLLVEVGWGLLRYGFLYIELEFVVFVLILFFGNLSHIVGHEFLCVFFLKHACNTKAFERPTVTVLDDTPAWWP